MRRLFAAALALAAGTASPFENPPTERNADPVLPLRVARPESKDVELAPPFVGHGMDDRAKVSSVLDGPRIFADPVGAPRLPRRRFGFVLETRLVLNDTKERVGAIVSLCDRPNGNDAPGCDSLQYVFPQLRVEPDRKEIRWKGEAVATYGLLGIKMRKGFRLGAEAAPENVDDGFNREVADHYAVFIERAGEQ